MDVTEYDSHKKRRSSLRSKGKGFGILADLQKGIQEFQEDSLLSSNGVPKSPQSPNGGSKGGAFSFEPSSADGGYSSLTSSGGSSGGGTKARMNEILSVVQILSEQMENMSQKQILVDEKLDRLLAVSSEIETL